MLHRLRPQRIVTSIPPAAVFLGISLLLILAAIPASGGDIPAPDVTISVDRQEATVGDPITLTLRVVWDSTYRLTPAIPGRLIGPFEVLSDSTLSDSRPDGDRLVYERSWRLAAFRPGTYRIPALGGGLADAAGNTIAWQSDSLTVTIASVLTEADADSADIHGLKQPWQASEPLSVWWYILTACLLLGAGGVWVWRRRRHPVVIPAPSPVPPWETALAGLTVMRQEIDPESDGGRLWYFRLSEILRRYVDGRYGWQSIDQTTTEIMRQLKKAPFDGQHRERFREFLGVADRVRYAREHAKVGRPEIDWDWAREFVCDTTPAHSLPDSSALSNAGHPAAGGDDTAAPGTEQRAHSGEEPN